MCGYAEDPVPAEGNALRGVISAWGNEGVRQIGKEGKNNGTEKKGLN